MTYTQQQGPNAGAAGDAWEYEVKSIKYDDVPDYKRTMNQMGADGWELVSAAATSRGGNFRYAPGLTTGYDLFFKRRVRGPR